MILTPHILKLHLHDNRQSILNRFWTAENNPFWKPQHSALFSPEAPDNHQNARAWDAVAVDYDQQEDQNQVLSYLRQNFQNRLVPLLETSQKVLDLGCGTGSDSLWLLEKGATITALDISEEMLERVKRKKEALLQQDQPLETICLSMNQLEALLPHRKQYYHGLISNFGLINCAANLEKMAKSTTIRPQGWVLLGDEPYLLMGILLLSASVPTEASPT